MMPYYPHFHRSTIVFFKVILNEAEFAHFCGYFVKIMLHFVKFPPLASPGLYGPTALSPACGYP